MLPDSALGSTNKYVGQAPSPVRASAARL